MFNRALIAGFFLVFVATSAYLWLASDSQSTHKSTLSNSAASMAKQQSDSREANKEPDQSELIFDTAPMSRQQAIDPLEDMQLPDLPSLQQEEREAQAIIAEMDRLIEQQALLDMPLDEEDEQALLQRHEELQQRLDALSQQFNE